MKAKEFSRTEEKEMSLQINNMLRRVPTDNTTYTYLGLWECVWNIKNKTNKQ